MTDSIATFLNDFQDNYVNQNTTINYLDANISKQELDLIYIELQTLAKLLDTLSDLSCIASVDALLRYNALVEALENKVGYISDTADVLLKINTFYNNNNQIVDLYNYNLRDIVKNGTIIYDDLVQGLTLSSKSNLYLCPRADTPIEDTTGIDLPIITFYNSNLCYHSGFKISSPFLELLEIQSVTVKKTDGTSINVLIPPIQNNELYFHHEILTSNMISFQFNSVSSDREEILDSLKLTLVEYEYKTYGSLQFEPRQYSVSDLFSILGGYTLPANTYANILIEAELLDINSVSTYKETLTLPVNNSIVCKRLDMINDNEIGTLVGMYVQDQFSTENLTIDYVKGLTGKNEKYVTYVPKSTEANIMNDILLSINDNTLIVQNKHSKFLKVKLGLEMFTFIKYGSPIITSLTGISKNETI